jgi:hypothetical protein
MNDEEISKQLATIHGLIEVLAKAAADQKLLTIQLMAHQQAHLAQIRHLLAGR